MSMQHKGLISGRWFEMPFIEQMANIGSEIERTINWKDKGNQEYSNLAFDRVLELLDLTIADPKNVSRLKELVRTREALADYFVFDNEYNSTAQIWKNYFFAFSWAAALRREKASQSER
ncbi:MAG: hypothetical protein GF401_18340 [Chitinivibrionales bacterium]|nr:hypothetical protein [Chitinivibrionales bacterium]